MEWEDICGQGEHVFAVAALSLKMEGLHPDPSLSGSFCKVFVHQVFPVRKVSMLESDFGLLYTT